MEDKTFITIQRAAELLNKTVATVYGLARQGLLEVTTQSVDGRIKKVVSLKDVQRIAAEAEEKKRLRAKFKILVAEDIQEQNTKV